MQGLGGDGAGWTPNSDETGNPTVANNVLTLTDGNGGEARSEWLDTPVTTGSFTAHFTYTPDGSADGVAFVLQDDPHGTAAPSALPAARARFTYAR